MRYRVRIFVPVLKGAAAAAVVGLLAGILRFAHLGDRGLVFWDEAKFALEEIRMEQATKAVLGLHASLADGKPVGSAKPGHALLIGLSYLLGGVHDYMPLLMSAACSVAACLLLTVLGWRLFGPQVGTVAGLLLAVSEYDVLYARSALSESDATLFLLLAVTVWLWHVPIAGAPATTVRLVAAGVALGAAFSINYRLIVYVAAVVTVDLAWAMRRDEPLRVMRRAGLWLSGLLLIPIIWLAAGQLATSHGATLFFNEITAHPASYAAEVIYQLHLGKQSVIRFAPLIYAAWYVNRDGPAASILLALGFVWCALRPNFLRLAVVALVALPYAAYTFAPFIVPRNLVAALPFAALIAAIGLVETAHWRPPLGGPIFAVAPTALALAVIGASMSWRLSEERSGFRYAARTVAALGGKTVTSTEVMAFYLRRPRGSCSAPAAPLTLKGLGADIRAGYGLAVLEQHHNSRVTHYIEQKGTLLRSWPVFGGPSLGESPVASENGTWPNPPQDPEVVYLYDIHALPAPRPGNVRPPHCRVRVPV